MPTMPTRPIEGLTLLLEQWVLNAPLARTEPGAMSVRSVWRRLAEALCAGDRLRMAPFHGELADAWRAGDAARPPTRALRARLDEIVAQGVQELFIVVAVRQALDQLIALDAPEALESWTKLANKLIPIGIQFAYHSQDLPPSRVTYTVQSDLEEDL